MSKTNEQKLLAKGWKRKTEGFVHVNHPYTVPLVEALETQAIWEAKKTNIIINNKTLKTGYLDITSSSSIFDDISHFTTLLDEDV